MNLDLTKAGRLLMVVNFVLTAGVVAAGADFFTSENTPVDRSRVFREVRAGRGERAEGKDIFRDYSSITGAKFRTRAETGKRAKRAAKPGATSALENTLRILGTMLSNNEAFNFAVLEDIHTGKQHTVGVGDVVGNVEILAIRADEVEVLLHGEKTVLPLDWKARVPEKGRSSGKRKGSRPGDRGKRNRDQGAAQGNPWGQGGATPAKPGGGGSEGHDEIGAYLAKMSPDLGKWWKKKSPKDREQWKKWWDGRSPEERKKYEKKFLKMAKSGKNKLK